MNHCDSAMDFDLDLALRQDNENPLYYVQYAHARICSILRTMEELGVSYKEGKAEGYGYIAEEERALIRAIANFPEEIVACAEGLETSRLTHYCMNVASCFHSFFYSVPFPCPPLCSHCSPCTWTLCLSPSIPLISCCVLSVTFLIRFFEQFSLYSQSKVDAAIQ